MASPCSARSRACRISEASRRAIQCGWFPTNAARCRRCPEMRETGRRFGAALLTPIGLLYLVFLIAPISFFLAMSVFKYDAFNLYKPELTGANFGRLAFDPYYRAIVV